MSKQKLEKPTIGCRVGADEMRQIQAICDETGQSRSDWLLQLVKEALGRDAATVRSMNERIAALEKKLARLAS